MTRRDQLGLFGDPPWPEALVALGERIPAHVRLGTSSWTFEGWKGLIYRRRYGSKAAFVRDSLDEYARYPLFSTVGVDRSYYTPLTVDALKAYARVLPDGFRACSKVWAELTTPRWPNDARHGKRAGQRNPFFLDAARFEDAVAGPLREAFLPHVGPLIVELPPSALTPAEFTAALARFLDRASTAFHYAFEIRSPALFTDRYLDVLRDHPHASHLYNLHTLMPTVGAQLRRVPPMHGVSVARLMLPVGKRYEAMKQAYQPFDRLVAPQPQMRDDVVSLARATRDVGAELYVIVNNKVEGSSPWTVRALAERLVELEDE
ncbi:MAG: DUF72 domain-containing protein [Sandaracinaceae bacterium]